jgi:transaldolase
MSGEIKANGRKKRVWLNFVNRNLIRSGKLKRLIDNHGVTGITPNGPDVAQCVARDKEYRKEIHELAMSGVESETILKDIVIEDARDAADVLLPVFMRTHGCDGFVGIDVSPELAYDVEGLVEEGTDLWKKVDRSNVMIQIPATKEAMPAIKILLQDGIKVNAMLLHSLFRYRDVAQAYIEGMAKCLQKGMPMNGIASAATFSAHPQLDPHIAEDFPVEDMDMLRNISSTHALSAHLLHREIFQNRNFLDLAAKGAQPQLLMWVDEADTIHMIDGYRYAEEITAGFPDPGSREGPGQRPPYGEMAARSAKLYSDIEDLLDVLQKETIKSQVVKLDNAHMILNSFPYARSAPDGT